MHPSSSASAASCQPGAPPGPAAVADGTHSAPPPPIHNSSRSSSRRRQAAAASALHGVVTGEWQPAAKGSSVECIATSGGDSGRGTACARWCGASGGSWGREVVLMPSGA